MLDAPWPLGERLRGVSLKGAGTHALGSWTHEPTRWFRQLLTQARLRTTVSALLLDPRWLDPRILDFVGRCADGNFVGGAVLRARPKWCRVA